jgi:hypothetical protein
MKIECVENDTLLFRLMADPMCRIFDTRDNRIDAVYEESGLGGRRVYNMLYDMIQDWFE